MDLDSILSATDLVDGNSLLSVDNGSRFCLGSNQQHSAIRQYDTPCHLQRQPSGLHEQDVGTRKIEISQSHQLSPSGCQETVLSSPEMHCREHDCSMDDTTTLLPKTECRTPAPYLARGWNLAKQNAANIVCACATLSLAAAEFYQYYTDNLEEDGKHWAASGAFTSVIKASIPILAAPMMRLTYSKLSEIPGLQAMLPDRAGMHMIGASALIFGAAGHVYCSVTGDPIWRSTHDGKTGLSMITGISVAALSYLIHQAGKKIHREGNPATYSLFLGVHRVSALTFGFSFFFHQNGLKLYAAVPTALVAAERFVEHLFYRSTSTITDSVGQGSHLRLKIKRPDKFREKVGDHYLVKLEGRDHPLSVEHIDDDHVYFLVGKAGKHTGALIKAPEKLKGRKVTLTGPFNLTDLDRIKLKSETSVALLSSGTGQSPFNNFLSNGADKTGSITMVHSNRHPEAMIPAIDATELARSRGISVKSYLFYTGAEDEESLNTIRSTVGSCGATLMELDSSISDSLDPETGIQNASYILIRGRANPENLQKILDPNMKVRICGPGISQAVPRGVFSDQKSIEFTS